MVAGQLQFMPNLKKLVETRVITSSGQIKGRFELEKVTSDIEDAIDGVEHILVVTPAFAHEGYADGQASFSDAEEPLATEPSQGVGCDPYSESISAAILCRRAIRSPTKKAKMYASSSISLFSFLFSK